MYDRLRSRSGISLHARRFAATKSSSVQFSAATCVQFWAAANIYEVLPLVCPSCGESMRIIAFISDPVPIRSILTHLDLPSRPPALSPARAPPQGELAFDQSSGFDPSDAEPIPDFNFDQSLPD